MSVRFTSGLSADDLTLSDGRDDVREFWAGQGGKILGPVRDPIVPGWVFRNVESHGYNPDEPWAKLMRAYLAHPDGRASPGDECAKCGGGIPDGLHWLMLERHMCSKACDFSVMSALKRRLAKAGITP